MSNRYRKKAIEVEAVQWTGENRDEVTALTGGRGKVGGDATFRLASGEADVGDWIVRCGNDFPYPVPQRIFEATYEPVGQERGDLEGLPRFYATLIRGDEPAIEEKPHPAGPYVHFSDVERFLPASTQPSLDVDQLREKLVGPMHDLASTIGRARTLASGRPGLENELDGAAAAVKGIRAALAELQESDDA